MDKDAAQTCQFSVRGPKGSILLVTTLTSSVGKTKSDIHICLKKVGGILADYSLESQFEKKGIIIAEPPPDIGNIDETTVEHAIEAGAEEVTPLDDSKRFTFTCEEPELHKAKKKLEELNYKIEEVKTIFKPKISVNLNDEEMELLGNIIRKLEQLPEVTEIHDNIA